MVDRIAGAPLKKSQSDFCFRPKGENATIFIIYYLLSII